MLRLVLRQRQAAYDAVEILPVYPDIVPQPIDQSQEEPGASEDLQREALRGRGRSGAAHHRQPHTSLAVLQGSVLPPTRGFHCERAEAGAPSRADTTPVHKNIEAVPRSRPQ